MTDYNPSNGTYDTSTSSHSKGEYTSNHATRDLQEYFNTGTVLNAFVYAVVTNDLYGAMESASDFNRRLIYLVVDWLQAAAPEGSYGNKEIADGWISKNTYFQQYQKSRTFLALKTEK